jgi:hypothetical protein
MRLRGDNVILRAGVKGRTPSLGQSNHYGLKSAKPAPQSMFEKAAARQWAVVEQPTRSAEDRFLAFRPFIGLILKGSKGSRAVVIERSARVSEGADSGPNGVARERPLSAALPSEGELWTRRRTRNRHRVTRHSEIDHGARSPWSPEMRSRWPRSRLGSR